MTNDLTAIKQILKVKLNEITNTAGWRDSIAIRPSADVTDKTQHAVAREMACRDLDRNALLARHVRAALDRIADGSYGACTECDEPISQRRLSAVPWAALCLSCQDKMEKAQQQRQKLAA